MPNARQRDRVLGLFEGLRLTDVCDAMDAVGLQDLGTMDRQIHPLWRDAENFAHRMRDREENGELRAENTEIGDGAMHFTLPGPTCRAQKVRPPRMNLAGKGSTATAC